MMKKRFVVGLTGMVIGGLVGWCVAHFSGWSLSTMFGILAGGILAVFLAERRGAIRTLDEERKIRRASMSISGDAEK